MFERHGVSEPLEVIKFKCIKCSCDSLLLLDGKCMSCSSEDKSVSEPFIPKKDGDK